MREPVYLNWPEPAFLGLLREDAERVAIEDMVNTILHPLTLFLHITWERSDDSGCPKRLYYLNIKLAS
jgi:hypothetical protein